MQKGQQGYIEGRLQTRRWEDSEGTKHITVEIVANEAVLLGDRKDTSQQPAGEQSDILEQSEELPF